MDKFVGRQAKTILNGVDVSRYLTEISVSHAKDKIDVTGFGDSKEYLPGFNTHTFRASGWYQAGDESFIRDAIESGMSDTAKQLISFFIDPTPGVRGKLYNFIGENHDIVAPAASGVQTNIAAQIVGSPIGVEALCSFDTVTTTVENDLVSVNPILDTLVIHYAISQSGVDGVVIEGTDDLIAYTPIVTLSSGFGNHTIPSVFAYVRCTLVGTALAPVKAIVAIEL